MLCILYVIVVGALLGVAGLLAERVLPPGLPRRWLWCVVIAASIVVPGYYRFHNTAAVTGLLGAESYDDVIGRLSRIASATLLLWGVAGAWRVWRSLRQSRASERGPGGQRLVDGVPVLVTSDLGPATVGLLRARVLVPRWVLALPSVQRRYVVRHEDEHRRAHDAALLFLGSLTLVLAPWNVALWWQLRRLHLAVEMDCDTRVVAALGDATAYGETLFAIAQVAGRGPRLQPAFLGGVGMLEQRLTTLLAPAPLRRAQRVLLPAMALALLLAVLAMPHPIASHASHTHGATDARVAASLSVASQ